MNKIKVSSNLFELNKSDHCEKLYSFDEFMMHAKNECMKYLNKKKIKIVLTDHERKKKEFDFEYKINNIRDVFEEKQFNDLVDYLSKNKNTYSPILTFHGTNSPTVINSIIKYGYLLPYEIHPGNGNILQIANGNYYGDGIYTSIDPTIAFLYNCVDKYYKITLLLNLVILGNIDYINKHDKGINIPIEGLYEDKYHSRISNDLKIIVSASGKYVMPIYAIDMEPSMDFSKFKLYLNIGDKLKDFERNYVKNPNGINIKKINFHKIINNFYSIGLPNGIDNNNSSMFHHFLIPTFFKEDKNINNFINCLIGKKNLYFYDKSFKKYILNNHEDYLNFANLQKIVNDYENLSRPLAKCLDFITNGNNNDLNIIYLFVRNPLKENYISLISRYEKFVLVKKICIKLIFFGNIDNDIFLIKTNLQTINYFESFSHSLQNKKLNEIFDDILIEINNIKFNQINYKIPYPDGNIGEGFIFDITLNPQWEITTYDEIMYKGIKMDKIYINNIEYRIEYSDNCDLIKMENILITLLSKFRNFIISNKKRYERYLNIIKLFCEELLKKLDEIDSDISKKIYYKVRSLFNEIKLLGNVNFSGEFFEKLENMKFNKKIIKRKNDEDILNPIESLSNDHTKGIGIRTKITSASEVEPWLLIIEYVSIEEFIVSQIYNSKQLPIIDKHNQSITSIYPDHLIKCYYGYLFTGNPYLYMKSQKHALPHIMFVSILGQIFRYINNLIFDFKIEYSDKELYLLFLKCYDLINLLNKNQNASDIQLIKNIIKNENIEIYLTEQNEIISICKLLGKLFNLEAKQLFDGNKYHRLAFGVLSESIMRSCKTYLKLKNVNYVELIQEVLNLNEQNINEYEFDIKKSLIKTTKFFKSNLTNCSPFSVVASLEFIERYHNNFKPEDIFDNLLTKKISMRNFLQKHMPNEEGHIVQLALFIQGIKYNRSSMRKDVKFLNPKQIIDDAIEEQKKLILCKISLKNRFFEKGKSRYLKLLDEAQPYISYHKFPKIFNYREIAEINNNRPQNDQVELMSSGLLKHHCCYPDCPEYLVNQSTKHDKEKNTRHGIFYHIRHNQNVLNNYVPSFHLVAKKFTKTYKDFSTFEYKFKNYFLKDQKLSKWFNNLIDKEEKIKILFNYLNNK